MTDYERVLREIGRRMAKEETRSAGFDVVFPAGTVLSCANCEEGLYKITTRGTTADLVLDEGTILKSLNTTIPPREAGKSLVGVKCGGRVYKSGKIHTGQEGWA